MSDHESTDQEKPTSKPEQGPSNAAASNADSPSKDPSSEKKTIASPPPRMDSTENMDLNTEEPVDISAKDFKGKGFNPSLYEAIKKLRTASMAPRQTGLASEMPRLGSLLDSGTLNKSAGYYRHIYDNKMNITFSFEPRCLMCHACINSPHHILGDVYQPACIILLDQHFPAALPATDPRYSCPVIIRIEDGTLGDLLSSFRKTMGKIKIPVGSVIVLSSLSHLARVGTAAYAADLHTTINNIEEDYSNRVRVVHGIPVVGGTVKDATTARSLYDILEWLEAVDKRGKYILPESNHMLKELSLMNGGARGGIGAARLHMKLPSGMRNRDSAIFMMGGSTSLSPTIAQPDSGEAAALIATFSKELNSEFVVKLDEKPDLSDGGLDLNKDKVDKLTIVVAGGSHAARLAESLLELHEDVIDLSMGGWTLDEDAAAALAAELADQLAGISGKAAVIIQPFDNVLFHGTDRGGNKVKSFKRDGVYHVEGELGTISKEEFKTFFETATEIFKVAKHVPTLIMGPIPRYVARGCCEDEEHITNLEDDDFGANVMGGVRALGQYLRQMVWHRRWRNVVVTNTAEIMGIAGDYSVEEAAVRLGDVMDLWGDSDPIHPRKEAYDTLARTLLELALAKTAGREDVASPSEEGGRGVKRPREERTGRRPEWTAGSVTAVARAGDRSGTGPSYNRGMPWGSRRGQFTGGRGGHGDRSLDRRSVSAGGRNVDARLEDGGRGSGRGGGSGSGREDRGAGGGGRRNRW